MYSQRMGKIWQLLRLKPTFYGDSSINCPITTQGPLKGSPWTKAELPLEGIFFALNFLPWEFLSEKKLEVKKTKTTKYTAF